MGATETRLRTSKPCYAASGEGKEAASHVPTTQVELQILLKLWAEIRMLRPPNASTFLASSLANFVNILALWLR